MSLTSLLLLLALLANPAPPAPLPGLAPSTQPAEEVGEPVVAEPEETLSEAVVVENDAGKEPEPAPVETGPDDFAGVFVPAEDRVLRLEPEAYPGPFKVAKAAAHGQSVKKGDVLLKLEAEELDRQLDAAKRAMTLAKAKLDKAEADVKLGKRTDELALQNASRAAENAEQARSWYEQVDGKQLVETAEMRAQQVRDSLADQEEELEQLRKMYKSEELTSETGDIVVRRALRQAERTRQSLAMAEERLAKVRDFDFKTRQQQIEAGVANAEQQLAALKAQQQLNRVQRETALATAEVEAKAAAEKLDQLKADAKALTIKAPANGTIYHGTLAAGQWQGSDANRFDEGAAVQPGPLMTLVRPGKIALEASLPEAKRFEVQPGDRVAVQPTAMPEATLYGTVKSIAPTARREGNRRVFPMTVTLDQPDKRLAPGFTAKVAPAPDAPPAKKAKPKKKKAKEQAKAAPADGTVTFRFNINLADHSVKLAEFRAPQLNEPIVTLPATRPADVLGEAVPAAAELGEAPAKPWIGQLYQDGPTVDEMIQKAFANGYGTREEPTVTHRFGINPRTHRVRLLSGPARPTPLVDDGPATRPGFPTPAVRRDLREATTPTAPSTQPAGGPATRPFDPAAAVDPYDQPTRRRPSIDAALADGVAFLRQDQNDDGSWGTGLETRGLEIYHSVPGSHDAFRVATTALCVMALRDAGQDDTDSYRRGLRYLVEDADARRDDSRILYNIWAHLYTLEALAPEVARRPDDAALRAAAQKHLDKLIAYEVYLGGWNYYDFEAGTQRPSMEATSFGTAAALGALHAAAEAGIDVPQPMIDRAVRRLAEMRTPAGSYLYAGSNRMSPRAGFNRPRGGVGRTQSAVWALWLHDHDGIAADAATNALDMLTEHHVWLEIGRKRPLPHEAWYQTSGYYYYFGHFYAARLIERLSDADRATQVAEFILPHQEADGSWWDYAMWDYHKPYGTAYAVMALTRLKDAGATGELQ
jgi:multidrug resistance efflux pump